MINIKQSYNVLGVMSGTSLDGIDICFATFTKKNRKWNFLIICCETIKYDQYWINNLTNAHKLSGPSIKKLNYKFTTYMASVILEFIKKYKLNNIDFISSHGHTILHKPSQNLTFQIGNISELNKLTNIAVVCDFRTQDIKYGGQGAPLVPIGDLLLFDSYRYCINLGGFSNISIKENSKIIAYDICAVNVVLNHYSRIAGLEFDMDGELSKSGKINTDLLSKLNSISFYNKKNPKSLAIEWVEDKIFPVIDRSNASVQDILRTYIEHISIIISKNIEDSNANILFTGGGVKNKFLLSTLSKKLNKKIELESEEVIDFKEALIFGFLGVLKIRNENNCLKSVTGAKDDHSSGIIFK